MGTKSSHSPTTSTNVCRLPPFCRQANRCNNLGSSSKHGDTGKTYPVPTTKKGAVKMTTIATEIRNLYMEDAISGYSLIQMDGEAPDDQSVILTRKDGHVMVLDNFIEEDGSVTYFGYTTYESREAIAEGDCLDQDGAPMVYLAETVTNWING